MGGCGGNVIVCDDGMRGGCGDGGNGMRGG